ncbi:MAG: phosphoribosylamine--glycine ligase [Gammaproteobacteria bacterium]|nr:phosphoribosylamine--glycine ligase [Gammaproteobacteria bacterium]
MKVLIIGQGGREHAIAWKIAQSPLVSEIYVTPGNGGTATEPKIKNICINSDALNQLLSFAKNNKIDLTIVGPEIPLVLGIVDLFQENNLNILGPNKAAAQLEGSKAFCKQILTQAKVKTAAYKEFTYKQLLIALAYIENKCPPYVIKADGLAAGKGVSIITTKQQGLDVLKNLLSKQIFGDASKKIIIEDFISGQELSFIVLVSNNIILPLASSQDHKTRDNHNQGPNTGGMGAYSPSPLLTKDRYDYIISQIIQPTLDTLKRYNILYNGFLYAGLMIDTDNNISVLEYNCRLGDPETQVILPRLESDFFELCYAAATNNLTTEYANNIKWSNKNAITIVLASRNYPDRVIKNEIIKLPDCNSYNSYNSHNISDNKIFHAATYLDQDNNFKTNGGRVLTVTQLADNINNAQDLAYKYIHNISWPSMFYRTDIGAQAVSATNET